MLSVLPIKIQLFCTIIDFFCYLFTYNERLITMQAFLYLQSSHYFKIQTETEPALTLNSAQPPR